ncbi:hypothetical protein FOCC_FOCC011962, partial [Frankliniella occidentalis]
MAAKGDAPAAMLSLLLAEGGSRLVVDAGSDIDGRTAREEGLHDVAKALLKGGADPNRTAASDGPKHSPLDLACFHGHYRVVRALVTDPRTDLEASGLSDRPLHAAVRGAAEASQEDGGVHAHCRCVK